jgi:glycosyltransferase involved in cell wall biosynthesis
MRLVRVAVNAEQLLYRSPGGIGRYTAQLLTVLPAVFPGDEVVPFTARHPRESVVAALVGAGAGPAAVRSSVALALPRPALYESWLSLGRPRLPRLHGAQVIHAPSVAVPPRSSVPLVVTVHDVAPELFPEAFPRWGRRFHRRGLAAAARRADVVITVSASAAEEITSHSSIGAERIRVIHNGVSPLVIPPEEGQAVLAARQLAGRPYVLWVGSLEPRKGVGTLVAAMAELRRRQPDRELQTVLAGYDGWLGDDLIDGADRASLGPSLHQLGRVGERELWTLYGSASVFAFPSHHEGFGLPVLEAMSQAVPVVASDIPALRELTAGTALLVNPGDVKGWANAIEGLFQDDKESRDRAAAAQARSRLFSSAAMVSATRAVYREIAS